MAEQETSEPRLQPGSGPMVSGLASLALSALEPNATNVCTADPLRPENDKLAISIERH